jgi:hypothetical protein
MKFFYVVHLYHMIAFKGRGFILYDDISCCKLQLLFSIIATQNICPSEIATIHCIVWSLVFIMQ